jgi:hypothetical protein
VQKHLTKIIMRYWLFNVLTFVLCSLCSADLIVSYDEDSKITVGNDNANTDTCLIDYTINYNRNDATYSSDYVSINVVKSINDSLRADIFQTGSTDNYSFAFLEPNGLPVVNNGDDKVYIYALFKYLMIYKNNVVIATTNVTDNNITILSTNLSTIDSKGSYAFDQNILYIINQNISTNTNCPLPTIMSYYCQIIDNLTIPENVMAAGIAVTLTTNTPLKLSKPFPVGIVISEIIVFVVVCVLVTMLMKARKDRQLTLTVNVNDSNAINNYDNINNNNNNVNDYSNDFNDPDNTNYYPHP